MSSPRNERSIGSETAHIAATHDSQVGQSQHVENGASTTPTMMMMNLDMAEPSDRSSSSDSISFRITSRLFISHFLSTWNSRLFEMGAVLFLAAIYPHNLQPMSIYALVRSAAATLLSPAVGSWIDRSDRLVVIRISIVGQRLAVGASCGLFWVLLKMRTLGHGGVKRGLFAVAVVLACVEKVCAVVNLVAVERDWVVVISERRHHAVRQALNARMRRIDLFCKLFGPLVISLVNGASTIVAIWVTLGMSCVSVLVEYFAIGAVFRLVPTLRRAAADNNNTSAIEEEYDFESRNSPNRSSCSMMIGKFSGALQSCLSHVLPLWSLPHYFKHPAFLPSISLSLLYLTVLSFSGQMITFLLGVGYSSTYVGVARTISTIFELSATWIAPKIQKRIGAIRGGIWFLTWQMIWLAIGVSWFFSIGAGFTTKHKIFAASGLVGSVILSRIGLWGFDLCAQSIVQEEVDELSRGAFSSVEASFQNLFELLSYLTTIVFSRPDQFRWPVVISVVAVYVAGGVYTAFVRMRRGHLLHPPPCFKA